MHQRCELFENLLSDARHLIEVFDLGYISPRRDKLWGHGCLVYGSGTNRRTSIPAIHKGLSGLRLDVEQTRLVQPLDFRRVTLAEGWEFQLVPEFHS
jgi:hypothetical protein